MRQTGICRDASPAILYSCTMDKIVQSLKHPGGVFVAYANVKLSITHCEHWVCSMLVLSS